MSGPLSNLVISGLAFLATHILMSSTALRGNLREPLGERGFLALYSAVAIATFAWFAVSFAAAPRSSSPRSAVPRWCAATGSGRAPR